MAYHFKGNTSYKFRYKGKYFCRYNSLDFIYFDVFFITDYYLLR